MPTPTAFSPARVLAFLVLSLAFALPARAGLIVSSFVDVFDIANWTLVTAGDGSIDLTSAHKKITLNGADDGSGPTDQLMWIEAPVDGQVSFFWQYESLDIAPVYDTFGYWINGQFTEVIDVLGGVSQFGSGAFEVRQGDRFGFVQNSFDSTGGAASSGVSLFSFVEIDRNGVPLPATLMLAGLGLALLGRGRGNRKVLA